MQQNSLGLTGRASYHLADMSSLTALLRNGWFFLVMSALCLIIKEQFPFSNFPMYSALPDSTNCLQMVDADDHIIPIWPVFGGSISVLKKQLNHELTMLREKGAFKKKDDMPEELLNSVGKKVLTWSLTHYPCKEPARKGQLVKLQEITFRIKDGKVVRNTRTLAEDKM